MALTRTYWLGCSVVVHSSAHIVGDADCVGLAHFLAGRTEPLLALYFR